MLAGTQFRRGTPFGRLALLAYAATLAPGAASPAARGDSGLPVSRPVAGAKLAVTRRVLARLWSAALFGVEASLVRVEVDVSFGLPTFSMVGLPDSSVRESRDRVRSAIRNSGFDFPAHRITINLAPADVRKRGTSFPETIHPETVPSIDLPIAVGVLAASGAIKRRENSPGSSCSANCPSMAASSPRAASCPSH